MTTKSIIDHIKTVSTSNGVTFQRQFEMFIADLRREAKIPEAPKTPNDKETSE